MMENIFTSNKFEDSDLSVEGESLHYIFIWVHQVDGYQYFDKRG